MILVMEINEKKNKAAPVLHRKIIINNNNKQKEVHAYV